ncbi:hypothetical protein [Mucilaginibacter sp.]
MPKFKNYKLIIDDPKMSFTEYRIYEYLGVYDVLSLEERLLYLRFGEEIFRNNGRNHYEYQRFHQNRLGVILGFEILILCSLSLASILLVILGVSGYILICIALFLFCMFKMRENDRRNNFNLSKLLLTSNGIENLRKLSAVPLTGLNSLNEFIAEFYNGINPQINVDEFQLSLKDDKQILIQSKDESHNPFFVPPINTAITESSKVQNKLSFKDAFFNEKLYNKALTHLSEYISQDGRYIQPKNNIGTFIIMLDVLEYQGYLKKRLTHTEIRSIASEVLQCDVKQDVIKVRKRQIMNKRGKFIALLPLVLPKV